MKLSDFELDVMALIWNSPVPLSTAEIHELVCQQKDVAHTTVKTILLRLEEKGAIARLAEKKGRALLYAALVTSDEVSFSWLPEHLDRFFEGSTAKFVSGLIQNKKLKKHELRQLKKELELMEKEK